MSMRGPICDYCEGAFLTSATSCVCGPMIRCSKPATECQWGVVMSQPKVVWPDYVSGQRYVRDKVGVIWLLVPQYDGGMATTATATGVVSVGINVLRNERGPLYVLEKDNSKVWENCPVIHPDSNN